MPTLNDYRKLAGYTSIRAFADAANLTPSIASQWLSGHSSNVNEVPLLALLKIDQKQYLDAYEESREAAQAKWREKHPVTPEMLAAHEASMTPAQKARIHQNAVRLGVALPEHNPQAYTVLYTLRCTRMPVSRQCNSVA